MSRGSELRRVRGARGKLVLALGLVGLLFLGWQWEDRPAAARQTSGVDVEELRGALLTGEFVRVDGVTRTLTQQFPGDGYAWLARADYLNATGQFDDALVAGQRATELLPGDMEAMHALYRAQLIVDPDAAVLLGRRMIQRRPRDLSSAMMAAEALLFWVSTHRAPAPMVAQAAVEARAILDRASRIAEMEGDLRAVYANSYFVEGDYARAASTYQEALEHGIPRRERASDVANAMAWTRFLLGDEKGAAQALRLAVDELRRTGPSESFDMLPKWEQYHLFLAVLGGERVTPQQVRSSAPDYAKLRKLGLQEHPGQEWARWLHLRLLEHLDKGDYGAAAYLLHRQVNDKQWSRRAEQPHWIPDEGTSVRCFYLVHIEQPENELTYRLLLGDLARGEGRKEDARYWYEEARKLVPGNAILEKRLASL